MFGGMSGGMGGSMGGGMGGPPGNFMGNPNMMQQQQQPLQQQQQPQRTAVKLVLKPQEKGFYSNMFQLANKSNSANLSGMDAVDFLKKSGLPKDKLQFIWRFSARTSKEFLTRDEFYCAIRMIAYMQNGTEVSEESLAFEMDVPYPSFDDQPKQSHDMPGASSAQALNDLSEQYPSLDQMDFSKPQQQPFMTSVSQMPNQQQPQASRQLNDEQKRSIWYLTQKDKDQYNILFQQFDQRKAGFLTIDEMKRLLEKTQLPSEYCAKIWDFSNQNEATAFTKPMFYIAMHLIYKVRNKHVPIPDTLPPELSISAFENEDQAKSQFQTQQPSQQQQFPVGQQQPSMQGQPLAGMFPITNDYQNMSPRAAQTSSMFPSSGNNNNSQLNRGQSPMMNKQNPIQNQGGNLSNLLGGAGAGQKRKSPRASPKRQEAIDPFGDLLGPSSSNQPNLDPSPDMLSLTMDSNKNERPQSRNLDVMAGNPINNNQQQPQRQAEVEFGNIGVNLQPPQRQPASQFGSSGGVQQQPNLLNNSMQDMVEQNRKAVAQRETDVNNLRQIDRTQQKSLDAIRQQNSQLESQLTSLNSEYDKLQNNIKEQQKMLDEEVKRYQAAWAAYNKQQEQYQQATKQYSDVKDERLKAGGVGVDYQAQNDGYSQQQYDNSGYGGDAGQNNSNGFM